MGHRSEPVAVSLRDVTYIHSFNALILIFGQKAIDIDGISKAGCERGSLWFGEGPRAPRKSPIMMHDAPREDLANAPKLVCIYVPPCFWPPPDTNSSLPLCLPIEFIYRCSDSLYRPFL